jgi:rhamnulokinase
MARMLAIDIGAESGRGIVGTLESDRLTIEEVHRFPNGPVQEADGLHWDGRRLFEDAQAAIRKAGPIDSIGIDTWGLDHGFIDKNGELLANPFHYRDARTDGVMEQVLRIVPKDEIFAITGIQFMGINTLYQLYAQRNDPMLHNADAMLLMPNLLGYWLTGEVCNEFSDATTTQCYDPHAKDWAWGLLKRLGIPSHFLGKVVSAGSSLGRLKPDLGLGDTMVINVATHDTGSAFVAAPVTSPNTGVISSGTWSIIGVESAEPVITPEALEGNLSNEGGYGNRFRLIKNITGLWIVQELRREWGDHTYEELTKMAAEAEPFQAVIDPDYPAFLAPGPMEGRIAEFCRATNQTMPVTKGALVRSVLEGLAMKYRYVIERLEHATGRRMECIQIVGGGSKNRLLCQLTANATGRPVAAGPIEATAIGNLIVQAISLGLVNDQEAGRQIVRRCFEDEHYDPIRPDDWQQPYRRLCELSG